MCLRPEAPAKSGGFSFPVKGLAGAPGALQLIRKTGALHSMPTRPKVFKPLPARSRKQKRKSEDYWRGSRHKRGYDNAWQRLRDWRLADEPLCRMCKAQGRVTAATEVDHIKRFRLPDGTIDHKLRLCPSNTQSLCQPCHAAKTADERRG